MSIAAVVELDDFDLPLGWTRIPPGPELATHLAAAEWSAMSDRELVAAMDAARRQATWAQSLLLETVGELSQRRHKADPYGGSDAHRRVCGEVSLELTVPAGQAEELVVMAESLPSSLPRTWAAMRTGEVDYDRARVMVDGVIGLDKDLARLLDAELIADAITTTKTQLRRRLTRAIKMADPEAHAQRTKTAWEERRVELWDNEDETCDLVGRNLTAVDAHAIRNRLTAAAQAMKADGDARPIDHIRLDLFRDLLRGVPLPQATQADRFSGDPAHQNMAAEAAEQIAQSLAPADDAGYAGSPGRLDPIADPDQNHRNTTAQSTSAIEQRTVQASSVQTDNSRRPEGPIDPVSGPGQARQNTTAETDNSGPVGAQHGGARERTVVPITGRRVAGRGSRQDGVGAAEEQIARALAEVADAQLTGLFERAEVEGRLDALPRLIGQAAQAMREALSPFVDSWCRATGNGDHGHPGYRPPVALQRLIQRRHGTCVYPTCNRRSVHCDLDHTLPYDKGGRTCKCNMAPLCRAHHRIIKQHPRWRLVQLWPGLLIWVAPAGTWHIVVPE